ncbi:MAG TPA: HEAT repeat domain-containing protein [Gemmatimonadales bacterium]|nr:HEAT repeat domain-containing protein [Gemmatimonadales bacterium]
MMDVTLIPALLGRLLQLSATSDAEGQRNALHALVTASQARSVTLRRDGPGLSVEGMPVETWRPDVAAFMDRLQAHGLAAVHLAHETTAVECMHLVRALASAREPEEDLGMRLREAGVVSVSLVTEQQAAAAAQQRRGRVTDALALPADQIETAEGEARPRPAGLAGLVQTVVDDRGSPHLLTNVDALRDAIGRALTDRDVGPALDALTTLIHHEADTPVPEVRRALGVAFRQMLAPESIRLLAPHLMDELYQGDVITVVRRAGRTGTKAVLDLLVEAPTYAERKAYLSALRQIEEGGDVVASMLRHHQWFVVRNAADLVGELRVEEAVAALGDVVGHDDARVRRSVGIALAKIGTPSTVRHLSRVLRDPDAGVRLAVGQQIGGRGVGPLAMPLLNAAAEEQDEEVQYEFYRAMGRIGTPDAVQALVKLAEPGGRLIGRRSSGPRLAAVEGLALAGGRVAVSAIEALSEDRAPDVREAARRALIQLSAG